MQKEVGQRPREGEGERPTERLPRGRPGTSLMFPLARGTKSNWVVGEQPGRLGASDSSVKV